MIALKSSALVLITMLSLTGQPVSAETITNSTEATGAGTGRITLGTWMNGIWARCQRHSGDGTMMRATVSWQGKKAEIPLGDKPLSRQIDDPHGYATADIEFHYEVTHAGSHSGSWYQCILAWGQDITNVAYVYVPPTHQCSLYTENTELPPLRLGQTTSSKIRISLTNGKPGRVKITGPDIDDTGNLMLGGKPYVTITPDGGNIVKASKTWEQTGDGDMPLKITTSPSAVPGQYQSNLQVALTCE